jgi:hypothetical protein
MELVSSESGLMEWNAIDVDLHHGAQAGEFGVEQSKFASYKQNHLQSEIRV